MTVLITGSSGYIAKCFIKEFNYKYDFLRFSLLTNSLNTLTLNTVDTVLHCAALVHQKNHRSYDEYLEVNTNYPLLLAQKAKEEGVKHFVFISTIAVHGRENHVLTESTLCNPETSYAKSKFKAEELLRALEDTSFRVSIIRVPMVYGENAPGNLDSLIKVVKRVALLPLGNIRNRRTFVYIQNLTQMIDKVIEKDIGGTFLAGDDKAMSTSTLIRYISDALAKKIYLFKFPYFKEMLKIFKPKMYSSLYEDLEINNQHTKNILDFKNIYDVETGIFNMLNYNKKDR